jgi:hypothetical protein
VAQDLDSRILRVTPLGCRELKKRLEIEMASDASPIRRQR